MDGAGVVGHGAMEEAMKPEEEWALWQKWLGQEPKGDTLYAQVYELLFFRQIWDGFAFIYGNAPEEAREEGTFLLWLRLSYARSLALGVRRMADTRSDVLSLARLIDRVWRYPTILTRERFLATQNTVGEDLRLMSEGWYTSMAGEGDFIDPRIPAQDFEDLQAKTKQVRDWVNHSVAHLTAKGKPRAGIPLNAVHDAADVVADLFVKYNSLIQGVTIHSGVIMSYWPTIFRVPWIADDDQYRRVLDKLDEAERRRAEPPDPHPRFVG